MSLMVGLGGSARLTLGEEDPLDDDGITTRTTDGLREREPIRGRIIGDRERDLELESDREIERVYGLDGRLDLERDRVERL